MSAVREPKERRDAALEVAIDTACDRMIAGGNSEAGLQAWADMCVLIRRRSPEQVAKMEIERRLLRRQVAAK